MKGISEHADRASARLRVVLTAALLLSCLAAFAGCASTDTAADSGTDAQPAVVNDTPQEKGAFDQSNQAATAALNANSSQASGKLAGAAETVDANGIVHGSIDGVNYTVRGRGTTAASSDKVTLCAVGDQLATDNSLPIAGAYADGSGYDFRPFYREVASVLQSYDLRYINQETVMATGAGYAVDGYPTFNSPDNMAETIAAERFNLVNFTTNHSYDVGTVGIEASQEVWDRYPQLLVGGSYKTQEDRETVHLIERNGMTFAFLAYCYGDNSYPDGVGEPNTYYACSFDKDLMAADIARAKQVADAVIVSMHWGTEYTSEPNGQQYEYAQWLADQDVDLVLGTHAHIMQPVKYITGSSGNTVPVCFGLSDFISGWTLTDTILSGIFTCSFTRNDDGGVDVSEIVWYPTIEWSDGGDVYVRRLKDMTDDEIANNTRTEDVSDDLTYLSQKIASVGMEVPVDM